MSLEIIRQISNSFDLLKLIYEGKTESKATKVFHAFKNKTRMTDQIRELWFNLRVYISGNSDVKLIYLFSLS